MRTHIEGLETRLAALERYVQGSRESKQEMAAEAAESVSVGHQSQDVPRRKEERPMPRRETTAPRRAEASASREKEPSVAELGKENTASDGYERKYRQVVRIELNTADSATLVRIPGIGEGTARAILQYRERLGGFYSAEQLREKLTWESAREHLDDWCENWFWTDENLIRKTNVNKLEFKELMRHPYLNYEDVRCIVKWRDRHGAVHNRADLEQLLGADSSKVEKLLHYVEF